MAIEAAFRGLLEEFHRLNEVLVPLQCFLGDKPEHGVSALIDAFDTTVSEMLGGLEEARTKAQEALRAVAAPLQIEVARRCLIDCQSEYLALAQQFELELASYEQLRELSRMGHARGGEWRSWAKSIRLGIEGCRMPLHAGSRAIAACWQEIAEHAGVGQVSIHTTNIGQKVLTGSRFEPAV